MPGLGRYCLQGVCKQSRWWGGVREGSLATIRAKPPPVHSAQGRSGAWWTWMACQLQEKQHLQAGYQSWPWVGGPGGMTCSPELRRLWQLSATFRIGRLCLYCSKTWLSSANLFTTERQLIESAEKDEGNWAGWLGVLVVCRPESGRNGGASGIWPIDIEEYVTQWGEGCDELAWGTKGLGKRI